MLHLLSPARPTPAPKYTCVHANRAALHPVILSPLNSRYCSSFDLISSNVFCLTCSSFKISLFSFSIPCFSLSSVNLDCTSRFSTSFMSRLTLLFFPPVKEFVFRSWKVRASSAGGCRMSAGPAFRKQAWNVIYLARSIRWRTYEFKITVTYRVGCTWARQSSQLYDL